MKPSWSLRISILSVFIISLYAYEGRDLGPEVVGYLGIPYAKPPVREDRLRDSSLLGTFDSTRQYDKWPSRCISGALEDGTSEDCLFLSIIRRKELEGPAPVLLYITNEEMNETKIVPLINSELTLVVAHAREGAFASFDGHVYGTSDIENIFKFLENEKERFLLGNITVWAEGPLAEIVSLRINELGAAISAHRAILFNGNALTRTVGRERFPRKVAYHTLKLSQCDLPSEQQSIDCLRAMSADDFVATSQKVKEHFYPFGDPFRVPANKKVANKQIPTIYGVLKENPEGYPSLRNFTAEYTYQTFKQFLAGIIPDAENGNAPLLRRLALHQYVHVKESKKDTYHLFETMREMLHDRDFVVSTHKLVMHLAKYKNNFIRLFEYGIDTPPKGCLSVGGWEDIPAFCDRLLGYYTRFTGKGAPTPGSCSPDQKTFPAMNKAKREYFVIINAEGDTEWDFNFHQAAVAFWNDLLPAMSKIELAGRRDAVFPEEQEVSPLEEEDDQQMWHQNAASDDRVLTEEKVLNDMPYIPDEL